MYYSEFALKLIEEVKKREILYNIKYERRPKAEKDENWREIANKLCADVEKCKKTWKNIRDRFVKIMHLRDRHFSQGGSELDAPSYIYYDQVYFMREFSIKKVPLEPIQIFQSDIIPERLVHTDPGTTGGKVTQVDYTDTFIDLVKQFPELYNEHAELNKYRSKEAWRQIADNFGGRFTTGGLRRYWVTLMKKYKLYLEHQCLGANAEESEQLFDSLSFVGLNLKVDSTDEYSAYNFEDEANSSGINESVEECVEIEGLEDENYETSVIQLKDEEDETAEAIMNLEDLGEPEAKKMKIQDENPALSFDCKMPSTTQASPTTPKQEIPPNLAPAIPLQQPVPVLQAPFSSTLTEDEFDYFGKKVTLQLRQIAQRNRSVARKGEIQVLTLLLELEESLDTKN